MGTLVARRSSQKESARGTASSRAVNLDAGGIHPPGKGFTLRRRLLRLARSAGQRLALVVVCLLMWELVARSGLITKALFPTPLQTWEAAKSLWRSGVVGGDLRASLGRVAVGFLIGSALGIAVGFATGVSRACNALLGPIITFLRPIPAIAVVPLSTAWFGIGQKGKYFIIAYAVVLAVWLYVHDGVARIPSVYVRVAKGYGLGRVKVLKRVLIPAAGPAIVSALRYGSSVAFLALVAAELGGAQNGIAYRLQVDSQFLQTGRIFVGLIELGVLGVSADYLIAKTGKRFVHWSTS